MKTLYPLAFALLITATFGFAANATADDQSLIDECNLLMSEPKTPDAINCHNYIRGFISGARVVDTIFIDYLDRQHNVTNSFTERAFRTRLGNREQTEFESPPFCLPGNATVSQLVSVFLDHAKGTEVTAIEALDTSIYDFLHDEFPCTQEKA